MVLDIRVKTESGEIIDIEMQASKFSTYNHSCFQRYGVSNIVSQTKSGDKNYDRIKKTFQIIVKQKGIEKLSELKVVKIMKEKMNRN